MQPTDILSERALQGNRHRQEKRIEPGVIVAFSNVASGRQNQSLLIV
jgi:hypothetical protein